MIITSLLLFDSAEYVLHHFLLTYTVPWDQKIVHKSDVMRRDVVDGSNESLYHANEENYTHL